MHIIHRNKHAQRYWLEFSQQFIDGKTVYWLTLPPHPAKAYYYEKATTNSQQIATAE